MKWILCCLCFTAFAYGCTDFEYSPYQAFDADSPLDLNAKNLERLGQAPADDTVRFVVSGDSQISQDEVVKFVERANTIPNLDMVFIAGDISEFGTVDEMTMVVSEYQKLKVPFFGVIGNHDLQGRGPAVFKRMFGALNYSILYGGVKFICHDTNCREYNFAGNVPDINWLQAELADSAMVSSYVAISHVRPFTSDFDPKLDTIYSNLFNNQPTFLASFHAHDHSFGEYYPNNSRIPYLVTTSLGERGFLLATITNNQISYEQIEF